jgi:hypothetical protein
MTTHDRSKRPRSARSSPNGITDRTDADIRTRRPGAARTPPRRRDLELSRRLAPDGVGARVDEVADVHKMAAVAFYSANSTVFRGEAQLSGRLRALCLIVTPMAVADEGDRRAVRRVVAEVGLICRNC